MLSNTIQAFACLLIAGTLTSFTAAAEVPAVYLLKAQVQPEPKDPTAVAPDSSISKVIKAMIEAEDARRRLELRQQIRAEVLQEFEEKRKFENETRARILLELQDAAKREEEMKKKILLDLENAAKQQNELRKLLTEQILREVQAGGGATGPATAPLAPGQTRVQILGTVGLGAGQGGVILEVDGQMRTLSVGDTFTSGGATFRVAGVTSQGVSIVAEKTIMQR